MHTAAALRLALFASPASGSITLAVSDDTGRVVGTAGLIVGEPWDLASFEVCSAGETVAAAALCHGIVQLLRVNRVGDLVVTPDPHTRALLAGVGLVPSSTSVAALLDRQRRINPEGYRLVTNGRGLELAMPHPAELLTVAAAARRELAPAG